MKSRTLNGRDGLAVGDIILMRGGKRHAVWFKNDSRAAVTASIATIEYREREGKLKFSAEGKSEDISPNSEVEIVERLGRAGLAKLIDRLKDSGNEENEEITDMSDKANKAEKSGKNKDNNKKAAKAAKAAKAEPRAGKLGGYEGHSVTSVLRAMGKAGWKPQEAIAFFEKQKIAVNPATVGIQIRRGRIGEGDVAPLSKDTLSKIKPKVDLGKAEKSGKKAGKPAKAEKAGKKDKAEKAGKSAKGKSEDKKSKDKSAKKKKNKAARTEEKPRPGDKAKEQIERLSDQAEEASEDGAAEDEGAE